jgi:hypothetical protein
VAWTAAGTVQAVWVIVDLSGNLTFLTFNRNWEAMTLVIAM